jgi:hypothetical protein
MDLSLFPNQNKMDKLFIYLIQPRENLGTCKYVVINSPVEITDFQEDVRYICKKLTSCYEDEIKKLEKSFKRSSNNYFVGVEHDIIKVFLENCPPKSKLPEKIEITKPKKTPKELEAYVVGDRWQLLQNIAKEKPENDEIAAFFVNKGFLKERKVSIKYLIEHSQTLEKDDPLWMALEVGNFNVAKSFLGSVEKNIIFLCFCIAVIKGNLSIVKFLYNEGYLPDVLPTDIFNDIQNTGLFMHSSAKRVTDLALIAAFHKHIDIVQFFYEKGAKFGSLSNAWWGISTEFLAENLFTLGVHILIMVSNEVREGISDTLDRRTPRNQHCGYFKKCDPKDEIDKSTQFAVLHGRNPMTELNRIFSSSMRDPLTIIEGYLKIWNGEYDFPELPYMKLFRRMKNTNWNV